MPGCSDCEIRDGTLCGAVPPAAMNELREGGRRLAAGDELVRQGEVSDRIHVVVGGWLCVYELMDDGRRQVLRFAAPGDLIGFAARGSPAPFAAMAMMPSRVCAIPLDRFEAMARRRPELGLRLSAMLIAERGVVYGHLTALGRRTAQQRVAFVLLELFCRSRARDGATDGGRLALPITQALLADALGLTPVHTNRMLQQLRRTAVIELGRRSFRVLDPDRLAVAAGLEPHVLPA